MPAATARGSAAVASRRQSTVRVSSRATVARTARPARSTRIEKPVRVVKATPATAAQPLRWKWLAAYVVVFAASLLVVVASYAYMAQQQIQVDRMAAERASQQRTYEQLRLKVAQLTAPERIIGAANQLGMITPDHVTYIQVTEPLPAASDPTAAVLSDGWRNVKADLAKPR